MAVTYFSGDDARNIQVKVQNLVADYLRGKLNDPAGPYYTTLGLSDAVKVAVTFSETAAAMMYEAGIDKGATFRQPFILLELGDDETEYQWVPLDGVNAAGTKHNLSLRADMSMANYAEGRIGPTKEADADRKLRDAVVAIVRKGYLDFCGLLLWETEIRADKEIQSSFSSHNPMAITTTVLTLDDE